MEQTGPIAPRTLFDRLFWAGAWGFLAIVGTALVLAAALALFPALLPWLLTSRIRVIVTNQSAATIQNVYFYDGDDNLNVIGPIRPHERLDRVIRTRLGPGGGYWVVVQGGTLEWMKLDGLYDLKSDNSITIDYDGRPPAAKGSK